MQSNINNEKKAQEIGNNNGARAPFERHSPHAYSYLQQLERLPPIHSLVATNTHSSTLIREQNIRIEQNSYKSQLSHPPTFTRSSLEPSNTQNVFIDPTQNNQIPTNFIHPPTTSSIPSSKPIKFYSFQYKQGNSSAKDIITNSTMQDARKRTSPEEKSGLSSIKKQSSNNSKVELSKEAIMKYMAYSQAEAADKLGVSLSTLRRRFTELNMNIRWPVHSKRSKSSKLDDNQNLQSSVMDNVIQQMISDDSYSSISGGSLVLDNSEKALIHNVLNVDSADPKQIDGDLLAALTKAFSSHENNPDET